MNESACGSTASPAFGVASVPAFGHYDRRAVVSHGCFNFGFPDDLRCGAYFGAPLPSTRLLW